MPALRQVTVPQTQPATQVRQTTVQSTTEPESMSVLDILTEAQELYEVRDPANTRINRLKASMISKLHLQFDEDEQLQLFDTLDNLAFADNEDPNKVVVAHPDISIRFQVKKHLSHKWKTILRNISLEDERLRTRYASLDSLPHTDSVTEEMREIIGFRRGLQWVLNQAETQTHHRLVGDFVSVRESPQRD
jgi:hypothetical protein